MDWADVAISAGEGAIIGATGGAALGVKAVGAVAKTAVDWKADGEGIQVAFVNKKNDKLLKDAIGNSIGFAFGLGGSPGDLFGKSFGSQMLGGVADGLWGGYLGGAYELAYQGIAGTSYEQKPKLDNGNSNDLNNQANGGNGNTGNVHGSRGPTKQKGAFSTLGRAKSRIQDLQNGGFEAWYVYEDGMYKVKIKASDVEKADQVVPQDPAW